MMELLMASGIGGLTAAGVYLCLRSRTFDVVLGLTLLSYAVNLFIFSMGRLSVGKAPILRDGVPTTLEHYADPLPQALVLTAIVISFAMTAVLLVLALRARDTLGSDHVDGDSHDDLERKS
jgi:multicomponent K+:H+ antiporter subunit C